MSNLRDDIAQRAFDLLADRPKPPETLECHHCHRREPFERMARASIANHPSGVEKVVRHFCHNNERSCYNERRGNYFE